MGLLPKVRLVIDKPEVDIAPEVAEMMKKPKVKKDQPPRFFTMKERLVIFAVLGLTILIGGIFWFSSGAKLPEAQSSSFNEETIPTSNPIVPHPQEDNSPFDWGGFNTRFTIEK